MVIDKETGAVAGILPKKLLQPGESVEVPSSGTKPYKMKRLSGRDEYTCTCPIFQNGGDGLLKAAPTQPRTCRHLKTLLGEAYEEARLKMPIIRPASSSSPGMVPIPHPSKTASAPKRKMDSANGNAGGNSQSVTPASSNHASPSPAPNSPTTAGYGNAVEVMLAHTFDLEGTKSPVGMWASEKLDGVRAQWDGQRLWSRLGNVYHPPAWWTARLPTSVHLDGELFVKRDFFDTASGWIRGGASDNWKHIHYVVFDVIDFNKTLEERWKIAKRSDVVRDGEMPVDQLIRRGGSLVVLLPQIRVQSREHLDQMLKAVEDVGGEGLMLRKEGSYYKSGRSRDLLKVKTFYDAEAIVIAYKPGTGKHEGRMGALRLLMENGKEFDCGTGFSDAERQYPPQRGSVVKYAFQELTKTGTPRFPSYKGIAIDKTAAKDAVVRSAELRLAEAERVAAGGRVAQKAVKKART